MSQTEPWTIGRLLQWTTDYLRDHGSSSPRLDSEVLLAEAMGCQRIDLYTRFDEQPGEAERGRFREWVRRRAQGEPVAYLVGHREFYSLPFRVTPDVLIPRPETEYVVLTLLDAAKTCDDPPSLSIADVGTGSGIIAVCAARHLPGCHVTAVDISEEALAVARDNARRHQVADRIDLVRSDLLEALPPDLTFHIIASNPPYVSHSELAELAPEVRNFEPRLALVAGPEGTEVIERLIEQAAGRIVLQGWLIMEISPMIEARVVELIRDHPAFGEPAVIRDLNGLPRVVSTQRVA